MSEIPSLQQGPHAPKKAVAGLYTIIALKLGKGLLLLLLALGIFSLVGDDLGSAFERFLRFVKLDPEREFFVDLGRRIESITPSGLKHLASGTLIYAILLFVESFGLMSRAFWAGWLAIGETAFFIPLELHKLIHHFSLTVLGILIINSAIVLYLVRNRQRLFHHHGEHASPQEREDWEV